MEIRTSQWRRLANAEAAAGIDILVGGTTSLDQLMPRRLAVIRLSTDKTCRIVVTDAQDINLALHKLLRLLKEVCCHPISLRGFDAAIKDIPQLPAARNLILRDLKEIKIDDYRATLIYLLIDGILDDLANHRRNRICAERFNTRIIEAINNSLVIRSKSPFANLSHANPLFPYMDEYQLIIRNPDMPYKQKG